jgi:hypothetical protein
MPSPRPYNLPGRHEADWPYYVGIAVFLFFAVLGFGYSVHLVAEAIGLWR